VVVVVAVAAAWWWLLGCRSWFVENRSHGQDTGTGRLPLLA
jgi:hypothetical protein